ncbi:MAG: hypothetical protein QY318_00855 [Candidatus Dojkabacteria bacterium]|nr:MAG: hypothetical protein QY318_00855 [Candidatus Dojkabacteria bacterium]
MKIARILTAGAAVASLVACNENQTPAQATQVPTSSIPENEGYIVIPGNIEERVPFTCEVAISLINDATNEDANFAAATAATDIRNLYVSGGLVEYDPAAVPPQTNSVVTRALNDKFIIQYISDIERRGTVQGKTFPAIGLNGEFVVMVNLDFNYSGAVAGIIADHESVHVRQFINIFMYLFDQGYSDQEIADIIRSIDTMITQSDIEAPAWFSTCRLVSISKDLDPGFGEFYEMLYYSDPNGGLQNLCGKFTEIYGTPDQVPFQYGVDPARDSLFRGATNDYLLYKGIKVNGSNKQSGVYAYTGRNRANHARYGHRPPPYTHNNWRNHRPDRGAYRGR